MVFTTNLYSQWCKRIKVISTQSFNQCETGEYIKVFEDDFSGQALDSRVWKNNYGDGPGGELYGNNGRTQNYWLFEENTHISNGKLEIITREENISRRAIPWLDPNLILNDGISNRRPYQYTSANIWTRQTFSYGKYEARVKIPKGKGFFPAFWLYGNPPVNEIDIFEFENENTRKRYDPDKLSRYHEMTIHVDYDQDGKDDRCSSQYKNAGFSDEFHVFSLVWAPNKVEWYVDDLLKRREYRYKKGAKDVCQINTGDKYKMNPIFPHDNPMHIIFDLAIQSGMDMHGNRRSPDSDTPFPAQMEIDYVRYYKEVDTITDQFITNASQIPQSEDIYNCIIGNNIEFDCDFTLQNNQQLSVVAKESILIENNFTVQSGGKLELMVDPSRFPEEGKQ